MQRRPHFGQRATAPPPHRSAAGEILRGEKASEARRLASGLQALEPVRNRGQCQKQAADADGTDSEKSKDRVHD